MKQCNNGFQSANIAHCAPSEIVNRPQTALRSVGWALAVAAVLSLTAFGCSSQSAAPRTDLVVHPSQRWTLAIPDYLVYDTENPAHFVRSSFPGDTVEFQVASREFPSATATVMVILRDGTASSFESVSRLFERRYQESGSDVSIARAVALSGARGTRIPVGMSSVPMSTWVVEIDENTTIVFTAPDGLDEQQELSTVRTIESLLAGYRASN